MTEKAGSPAYTAAHFLLELDDKQPVGFTRSVEGGGVRAEILNHHMGQHNDQWRQLSKPKYDDFKIQVGMSMADNFYDWIKGFFTGEIVRKNGALVAADYHYEIRARREFFDALISELGFPTVDAKDKNAAYLTVSIVPERIRFLKGDGKKMQPSGGGQGLKMWNACNFDFAIDGFEAPCRRVTKVDGFTIKQKILEYHAGSLREAMRVPGILEFPNISFYVPEADADPFFQHFTKRVISGEPAPDTRLTGHLTAKGQFGEDLCSIMMQGIDIAAVTPDKSQSGSEDFKMVKIEISVEKMHFEFGDPAAILE